MKPNELPPPAQLMKFIVGKWISKPILNNCHKAMRPGSKLLIVEMIVPPGNEPSIVKLLDLEMLVTTGGCERTENEFKILLETSGFEFSQTIATQESIWIIEGIRL